MERQLCKGLERGIWEFSEQRLACCRWTSDSTPRSWRITTRQSHLPSRRPVSLSHFVQSWSSRASHRRRDYICRCHCVRRRHQLAIQAIAGGTARGCEESGSHTRSRGVTIGLCHTSGLDICGGCSGQSRNRLPPRRLRANLDRRRFSHHGGAPRQRTQALLRKHIASAR